MIHLIEVDLAAPAVVLPTRDPVWALVRDGRHVLGELRLPNLDADRARCLHDEARSAFAPIIANRAAVHAEPAGIAPPPRISVIVCTRDRTALLATCLDHLAALDPPPDEVIVVDNAPTTDATDRLCRERGVRRVLAPRPGLDRARNAGWAAATGDVVAYIDDDAIADRYYCESLQAAFGHPGIDVVTGLVLASELDSYSQLYFERRLGGMRKGFAAKVHSDRSYHDYSAFRLGVGTNMAFRRSVLESLGGFDPRLDVGTATRGGGDLDMLHRAVRAGHVLLYDPDVLVRHRHRTTRAQLLAQSRDNGVAFSAFLTACEERGEPGVKRYRQRWHLRHHAFAVARALRRRDLLGVQWALAEFRSSFAGRAALASEDDERRRCR